MSLENNIKDEVIINDEVIITEEKHAAEIENNHVVLLKIIKAPPKEINPGAYIGIKIQGLCTSGCNLKATVVQLEDSHNNIIKEIKLILENGRAWESDAFIVRAPSEPGEHTWTVRFLEQMPPLEKDAALHDEALVDCKFTVLKQHATSMASWDIPSPVTIDSGFSIKVGVRCSNNCSLAGRKVSVEDSNGAEISNAILNEIPLQFSESMYWAQFDLQAPDEPGYYDWRAIFIDDSAEELHLESRCAVGFTVVPIPKSTISVNVKNKDSGEPISGIKVLVPPYRAITNDDGLAQLMVANGKYKLTVAGGNNYHSYTEDIRVDKDFVFDIELAKSPPVFED